MPRKREVLCTAAWRRRGFLCAAPRTDDFCSDLSVEEVHHHVRMHTHAGLQRLVVHIKIRIVIEGDLFARIYRFQALVGPFGILPAEDEINTAAGDLEERVVIISQLWRAAADVLGVEQAVPWSA